MTKRFAYPQQFREVKINDEVVIFHGGSTASVKVFSIRADGKMMGRKRNDKTAHFTYDKIIRVNGVDLDHGSDG